MGKDKDGKKELGAGISEVKDKYGKFVYRGNYIDCFGKRKYIYDSNLTNLRKRLREKKYESDKRLCVKNPNTTLDEWYDIWINTYKKGLKLGSLQTYQNDYRLVKATLGKYKLVDLNALLLQSAINELDTKNKQERAKHRLVDILDKAVQADYLLKNYAKSICITLKDDDDDITDKMLTKEQVDILLEYARKSSIYPILVVALYTGLRIGEIIGLTWDCIDFENGEIKVNKTLFLLSNNGNPIRQLQTPKTKTSCRDVPMYENVKQVLLEQKIITDELNKKYAPQKGFENLVFVSRKNKPLNASNQDTLLKGIIKKINAENPDINMPYCSMHWCRHTFTSNAIDVDMNPEVVQTILGHASITTTLDIYTHVKKKKVREQMALMGKVVGK